MIASTCFNKNEILVYFSIIRHFLKDDKHTTTSCWQDFKIISMTRLLHAECHWIGQSYMSTSMFEMTLFNKKLKQIKYEVEGKEGQEVPVITGFIEPCRKWAFCLSMRRERTSHCLVFYLSRWRNADSNTSRCSRREPSFLCDVSVPYDPRSHHPSSRLVMDMICGYLLHASSPPNYYISFFKICKRKLLSTFRFVKIILMV